WEFFNVVGVAPGQSQYVAAFGNTSANDELHVVVVDDNGLFTGVPGSILEVYNALSRATDAKAADTTTNYYKNVINQGSAYIWWTNDRSNALSSNAATVVSSTNSDPLDLKFVLGTDGADEFTTSLGVVSSGYDLFASAEDVDVDIIVQGHPLGGSTSSGGFTVTNYLLANYIIDNLVNQRKDCIVAVSPDKATVVNNAGLEAQTIVAWRNVLHSTSYAVLESGYKYQYDRYNDLYRWIPLNADIAGLCARTDQTNDAWWSPAGYNRGQIQNLVKLAYNPKKADRDILYPAGVNPVVTVPGQGTVLLGDKTLQAKPSAFDRINVRRLFITLEKAIAIAAKFSLFEFNDDFTRRQFVNLVTPYLRQVQGRRGITDFTVVCDSTNNTAQVIDSDQFVGDIYIKPARAINFINLNFVAVGTGVQFSEVIGSF
ncbi:MAG: phage tail sheath C-terminal domain-containing protein, partial [Candidatus Paceibacteria bacterium]